MPTLGEGDLPTPTGHPASTSGVAFGASAVTAYQGGTRVYLAVGSTPAAELPGAPAIVSIYNGGGVHPYVVQFTAPTSDGGAPVFPITGGGYKFYLDGVLTAPNSTENGTFALFATNLTGVVVEVAAVNGVGEGPKSVPRTGLYNEP